MRLTAALPLRVAVALHRRIGAVLYRVCKSRRRVVARNLEICFPELSAARREDLTRCSFEETGASFAEICAAWFAPCHRLEQLFEVIDLDHVKNALARGKGVILYTGHFSSLEICARPLRALLPRFVCMFSRRSNDLLEKIQCAGRRRVAHDLIPSDNVRGLLRSLKENAAVWYAADQVDESCGALVPFFGEPAMTGTAASRLARVSGATVVPFSYRRLPCGRRYELRFHPPLEDFPTRDAVADTRRLVRRLEGFVRDCPEQYQWLHKRFRGRPETLGDPYR